MSQENAEQNLSRPATHSWQVKHAKALMHVCGWLLPAHYGDPEAEYFHALSECAVMDASFLSLVEGKGRDHIEYLNRRLSQRVIELPIGTRIRANQLNGEGRMEADLDLLLLEEQRSVMIAPPAVTGDYLQFLADKYVFSEDAVFSDLTPTAGVLFFLGKKTGDLLRRIFAIEDLPKGEQLFLSAEGNRYLFATRLSFMPEGIAVVVNREAFPALWEEILQDAVVKPIGFLPFDTLRVEAGKPWWGIDLNARSIPLEADLRDAIHFNKGCYPGQETIARIINLGHPPRKLMGIVWDAEDPPPAETPIIIDQKEVGKLTSSTYSPRLGKAVGLAMMRWQHREPGTVVSSSTGFSGRLTELPILLA